MGACVCVGFIMSKALCLCHTRALQPSVLKSLFVFDSQELHCDIAGPPKACWLTIGLGGHGRHFPSGDTECTGCPIMHCA